MRVVHSQENKQLLEALQTVDITTAGRRVIQLPQSRNMEEQFNRKGDEFEVDFE